MNNEKQTENRKCPRFILLLPLEINAPDFHLETSTKNVSCSGIFCEINRFIPVKTELSVTMRLSLLSEDKKIKRTVTCPAKVIRIVSQKEISTPALLRRKCQRAETLLADQ